MPAVGVGVDGHLHVIAVALGVALPCAPVLISVVIGLKVFSFDCTRYVGGSGREGEIVEFHSSACYTKLDIVLAGLKREGEHIEFLFASHTFFVGEFAAVLGSLIGAVVGHSHFAVGNEVGGPQNHGVTS